MKSRTEVDAELDRLEAMLPDLIRDYGDEAVEAFAGEAEPLESAAEHCEYISQRITAMLVRHELIPPGEALDLC